MGKTLKGQSVGTVVNNKGLTGLMLLRG